MCKKFQLWRQPLAPLCVAATCRWCCHVPCGHFLSWHTPRTITSLSDMLLWSFCARAHSATSEVCDLLTLHTRHSCLMHYSFPLLSEACILSFLQSWVFSVVAGYVPGTFCSKHNERVIRSKAAVE